MKPVSPALDCHLRMSVKFNFVCLVLLQFNLSPVIAASKVLYHYQNDMAKFRFCSQKYFDSVSFNGQSYKFTVNRKQFHPNQKLLYIYEEFLLTYIPDRNLFSYESTTFQNFNQGIQGGFYIPKLNIFVEFYKNLSRKVDSNKKYSFCPYYEVPKFVRFNSTSTCSNGQPMANTAFTSLNLCDWRHVDQLCFDQLKSVLVKPSLFPGEVSKYLSKAKHVSFVFQFNSNKLTYIFSDKSNPFVITIPNIFEPQFKNLFFVKDIPYKKYKFVGAFNWKSIDQRDVVYVLVESKWKRTDSILLELLDEKQFVLSSEPKSWKMFFGCEQSMGYIEYLTAENKPVNHFFVYIFIVFGLIALLVLVACASNMSFAEAIFEKLSHLYRTHFSN